jgi:hypothetical protein
MRAANKRAATRRVILVSVAHRVLDTGPSSARETM